MKESSESVRALELFGVFHVHVCYKDSTAVVLSDFGYSHDRGHRGRDWSALLHATAIHGAKQETVAAAALGPRNIHERGLLLKYINMTIYQFSRTEDLLAKCRMTRPRCTYSVTE